MVQPVNPYIAGAPLRGERGFFGRQDTLDWVARELRNPATNALVLFGQRRIGKTTLLLQLERFLPADGFLPIYFDLQDQATRPLGQVLADLADTVAERADLEPPDPETFDDWGRFFHHSFLPHLYHALGEDCRPVFLLDEFDVLAQASEAKLPETAAARAFFPLDEFDVLAQASEAKLPETAAARAFFPFLRRVMTDDRRPAFVFVVGRRAEDLSLDFTATFKASLVREVWVLDRESADVLVRQAEANGTLRFTGQAVECILSLTSCHPYLTQLLCQRLWERAYAGNPTAPPRIDVPEMDVAVPDVLEVGDQALVWLWNGLSPAEKIYAAALAEAAGEMGTISEDQVVQVLMAHAARLRRREVELAPRDLVKRRILEVTGEREYRFAVELFRRWVRKNKPLEEVKDELDRIEPFADRLYEIGKVCFNRHQWEDAIHFFQEALKRDSRHFRARLYLGEALLELGQTGKAVAELERAHELDQGEARLALARVLVAHAKALEEGGDETGALVACERALQVFPDEQAAQMQLAILRREEELARLFDEGIKALKQGNWEQARRALAEVVHRRLDYEKDGQLAVRLLERAVVGKKATAPAWQLPGWAWVLVVVLVLGMAGVGWRVLTHLQAAPTSLSPIPTPTPTTMPTPAPTRTYPLLPSAIPTSKPLTQTPTLEFPVLAGTPVPRPVAVIFPGNADRVTHLARWGRGAVNEVACSPDGTLLAVASSTGIYLYNAQPLTNVCFIETDAWVNSVAFSPDGATLVSGSEDHMVRLWRVDDGTLLHTLDGHTAPVNSVVFSPDGTMMASGSVDGTVRLWRVDYKALRRTLEGHTASVNSVAFSPDGTMLVSGSRDGTVWLWRVDDGTPLLMLGEHANSVNSVAFSPDGMLLASGSGDHKVRLWQVDDGSLLRTLEGHTGSVNSVTFALDGVTLASGSDDHTVRQWWVDDGVLMRTLEGHAGLVNSVAFLPDGVTLASGSRDGTVRLWRVDDGRLLRTLEGYLSSVNSVAFLPDGAMLASGSEDCMVRLWRVGDGTLLRTLEGHTGSVHSVAFAPDGATLASGSVDRRVRLWRVDDGTLLRTLEGCTSSVNSVTFLPDGTTLASGSVDGTVRLWRVDDGTLLHTLEGHMASVTSVAFSPDGMLLASASDDHAVLLWQVNDGSLLRILEGHAETVMSVAFSPDGTTLASASRDFTVRLWRVDDGTLLHTLEGHTASVTSVAFSPDGALLASVSDDKTMRLWQVDDGALLRTLEGHRYYVISVAFSPDGATLASGSLDGTVWLWGVVGD